MQKKVCNKCGKEKNVSEFARSSASKDGLNPSCKQCFNVYKKSIRNKQRIEGRKPQKRETIRKLIDGVWYRRCGKCKKWKPFGEFGKRNNTKDGLSSACLVCSQEKVSASKPKYRKNTMQIVRDAKRMGIELKKTCVICGEEKRLGEFGNQKSGKYGKDGKCILCRRKKQGDYRKTHKVEILQYNRKYLGRKPREIKRKFENGQWYKWCPSCQRWKTFDKFCVSPSRSDGLDGYCKFCKRLRAQRYRKQWIKKNLISQRPDNIDSRVWSLLLARVNGATQRAEEWEAEGIFTPLEFIAVCEKYGMMCIHPEHMAVLPLDELTPDHVIPLSLGGSNKIDNIQPMCFNHNRLKKDTIADYRR